MKFLEYIKGLLRKFWSKDQISEANKPWSYTDPDARPFYKLDTGERGMVLDTATRKKVEDKVTDAVVMMDMGDHAYMEKMRPKPNGHGLDASKRRLAEYDPDTRDAIRADMQRSVDDLYEDFSDDDMALLEKRIARVVQNEQQERENIKDLAKRIHQNAPKPR